MNFKAIWQWIDRDLDQIRPWSFLLVMVPFIPFAIALEFTEDQWIRDSFLTGGLAVAAPWFLYVMWRGLRNFARSVGVAAGIFRELRISRTERILRLIGGAVVMVTGFALLQYFRN